MGTGSVMLTGIDRLIELLKDEGALSIKSISLKLGVSSSAVMKWGRMLEEAGLVALRYKFSTAYLEPKGMTEKIAQVKKDLTLERDIIDEKLVSTNSFLISLENEIDKLQKLFGDIGGHFNANFNKLQQNLKQLSSFQSQKESTDKQIISSKARFLELLKELEKRLSAKKSDAENWYGTLYSQAVRGGELLKLEKKELSMLESNEKMLEKKLSEIRALMDRSVLKKMASSNSEASQMKDVLSKMEKKYLKMKEELMSEKAALDKLIADNEKTVANLEKTQKSIIDKIDPLKSEFDLTMKEIKEAPAKLKLFFDKKSLVERILNKIHFNEVSFKKSLHNLMRRSEDLGKETSLEKFKKELVDLQTEVEELEFKRNSFREELKELVSVLEK